MSNFIDFEFDELKYMKKKPEKLFYKGNLELLKKPKISIVGTRKPNSYTKQFTHILASRLSNLGICIVSGAAMGVDAIAHNGAGEYNTIAVVANGLDIKYPKVNSSLISKIEKNGLLLSQFEDGYKARVYSFVQRNELVVSLGNSLIVTQADLDSGSLHSVNFALKQNKKVYVLAHRCGESLGTNNLLKTNQAEAIYDIDDFLMKFEKNNKREISDDFLEYCKNSPSYEEALKKFSTQLFEYELSGKIKINNGFVQLI